MKRTIKTVVLVATILLSTLNINAQQAFELLDSSDYYYQELVLSNSLKFVKVINNELKVYDNHLNYEKTITIDHLTNLSNGDTVMFYYVMCNLSSDKLYDDDDGIELFITINAKDDNDDISAPFLTYMIYRVIDDDGTTMFEYNCKLTDTTALTSFSPKIINNRNSGSYLFIQTSNPEFNSYYEYFQLPGKLPSKDVPVYYDDQKISLSGDTLYLEDGGSVYLGNYISSTSAAQCPEYNVIPIGLNPNPATTETTLTYSSTLNATILIYDLSGLLIDTYDAPSYNTSVTIMTSGYLPATYTVVYVDEKGATSTNKLVVVE